MSHNSFGHLFRFTTWGESHGPALGCVVDGCPPRVEISEAEIQHWLDKRKPGQSKYTTQRKEPDAVKILSGVMPQEDGTLLTTGTPISMMIENTDQRSKDYGDIANRYRPGHADFAYDAKYGIRDYRGGGRSSARETAARVAAGAIARKVLDGVTIRAALVQVGPRKVNRENWDWDAVNDNPFFCPDRETAELWASDLDKIRKAGSSVGAVIEVVAEGVPAGWGAPVYGKLDQDIASAFMSINAVKGVEIGNGFEAAAITGEENADEIRMGNDGQPRFLSNKSGGMLGGISSGQPVVARFAVKPTSSILTTRQSIDKDGNEVDVMTKGRHDPCVGIRAVPIGEAMMACVLADHMLRHRGQNG
ncbi:chorismate synthase [Ahrensia sp. R2A130]|uniref:chorismate synthase n=1 Tax=Ahrensia sp. R2A130 TaxID=744979 RepID=UPI0001E0D111|nr:chorismate synthase [Ahrensia sp. R2A130]EFL88862.1 chorismate synthase [Ahrensia sp. R2A130]